ncbi:7-cyano-7-deazaguanine synthase [Cyclobacterium sp. SYSU L10401]|uniref:7-cyano-7-deazaguanine synthase n=1 Tax=Cyclobacterium sp. SYSU L10401 TaxID=2678657 RepID=UPI0013D74C61|nr:7-cyano-7-deazaguanine synthase [Cyclobacterium sp. SYSU L10401]
MSARKSLNKTSILVCFSGGVDSVLMLSKALQEFEVVECLTISYPERSFNEIEILEEFRYKYPLRWIEVNLVVEPTYQTMLSLAIDICAERGIDNIGIGVIKDDLKSSYGQVYTGTKEFFRQIIKVSRLEKQKKIELWLPLLNYTKEDVLRETNN